MSDSEDPKVPGKDGVAARVLVVDDHTVVRDGVMRIIREQPDLHVVGGAGTIAEALDLIGVHDPDIAVVDLSLGEESGIELIKTLRERESRVACLVLSMHDESAFADRCIRAGARGYVMKQAATKDLVDAIRAVRRGETWLSNGARPSQSPGPPLHPVSNLSDRELEVLQLLGAGMGTREIAERLRVSVKTVESHRAHIKDKLGIATAPELVVFAARFAQGTGPDSHES
ncbi:MAG: response regulator transcription factor [Myxococcales bacterium]|nr:response regulator transcription factor [Myxococcales bacterium]